MTFLNPAKFAPLAFLPFRYIGIVGVSGSGKTTLAKQLANRFQLQHVELDALYWDPGWQPTETATFRQRAQRAFSRESWVVDGNHPDVRDLVWRQADTIIWLDYPLPLVMSRLIRRTLQRRRTKEELWNGNQERPLLQHLFSKKSIFLWSLQTYPVRRREYSQMFHAPEYQHMQRIHLRSPYQTQHWLDTLSRQYLLSTGY